MKNILIILIIFIGISGFAQKIEVVEGSFKNLKGIVTFNVEFNYNDIKVHGFETEASFMKDKMDKRTKEGEAEAFKNEWFSSRKEKYEPDFIESFNSWFENIQVVKEPTQDYTLNVSTIWIYPGYQVVAMNQEAKIEALVSVYKTDAPDTLLWSAKYSRIRGNLAKGSAFNPMERISAAYIKLARAVATSIKRKAR